MPDKELAAGYTRMRFRDLEPLSSDQDNKAFAQYISAAPVTPLGHEVLTVTSTFQTLSPPAETRRVNFYPITNDIYFTDGSAANPSASFGFPMPADTVFIYDSEPVNLRLWAASSTEVRACYYG